MGAFLDAPSRCRSSLRLVNPAESLLPRWREVQNRQCNAVKLMPHEHQENQPVTRPTMTAQPRCSRSQFR